MYLTSLLQDLLTDEPFVKKDDVIVLQDPANPALRDINRFHYIVNREAKLEVQFLPLTAHIQPLLCVYVHTCVCVC
jgi:hypothetical protein